MKINCEYKTSDDGRLGDLYTCTITSTSITEPNKVVKAFNGKHEAGRTNFDAEAICFDNTECHFMPRGIGKIFPKLKTVGIISCGLKKISREDLVGLKNIEELSLHGNELRLLPDDLFIGKKKLTDIIFSINKLEFVSSQLLKPVQKNHLNFVSFQNNPTINVVFSASVVNPSRMSSGRFVDFPGLMKMIDEKCKKPQKDQILIYSVSSAIEQDLKDFNSNLMKELENFWTSSLLSDFTIIVGDKKFKVHKFALALQSGFFKKMFVDQAEAIAELRNEDFSAETVEEVLRWIYTGQVPDNDPVETLALAVKLDICALKLIAENSIIKKLNQGNAMEIFELAHRCDSEKLIKAAFDEVKKILDEPDLDEELMKEPEELKKIVEVKKNYEKLLENRKKRKLN